MYATMAAVDTLLVPWNLLANGLFGAHLNTTPSRRWYEGRLRTTFMDDEPPDRLAFPNFERLLAKGTLPFFIINTTAYIEDDRNYYGAKLANSVFEFTPLWMGSDAFGYTRDFPPDLDLARAVAISGAAADSSTVAGSSQKTLLSALNQDLGYYIDNYRPGMSDPSLAVLLPFPLYYARDDYRRDREGRRIYLTDGGHSENLGAFSLVRRLCRDITIVDAEHDPEYRFHSYFKLKDALRSELGVNLNVPAIEGTRPGVEWCRRVRPDAPPTCASTLPDGEDWRYVELGMIRPGRTSFVLDISPYMEGTVRRFPGAGGEPLNITVRYIKLALDTQRLTRYNDKVRRYYQRKLREFSGRVTAMNPSGCTERDPFVELFFRGCMFPQQPTSDQNFSPEQFAAYRWLGNGIVLDEYLRPRPGP
jgi:hypothetical protein